MSRSTACALLAGAGMLSCRSDDARPDYPAFPLSLPEVHDSGGQKMTSPKLVVLVDPEGPHKPEIVAALEYLRTSDYWSVTTGEYGIGPIREIEVRDPPSVFPLSVTQNDVAFLVASYVNTTRFGGKQRHSRLLTQHADELYVAVLPPTTHVSDLSCSVGGYHYRVEATLTDEVPYAFTRSDCTSFSASAILVHEIVEAVTDPFHDDPALATTDADHVGWNAANAGEIGDLCVGVPARFDANPPTLVENDKSRELDFPTMWSNRLAKLGQDPCVPKSSSSPRVFATALPPDGGVDVRLGETITVPVRIATDRPTERVVVWAGDMATAFGPPEVNVTLARDKANNGDVLQLTITRRALPTYPTSLDASVVALVAETADATFSTYLVVGAPP